MNKPYFVYSDDDGMKRFATREEQRKYLNRLFEDDLRDSEGWLDGVESLCAGVLTEEVKETRHAIRPEHIPLDQAYYSKHGEDEIDWPAGVEEFVDYEIVPVGSASNSLEYCCEGCGYQWVHIPKGTACDECGSEEVVRV